MKIRKALSKAPRTREILRKGFYRSIEFLPTTAARLRRALAAKSISPGEIEAAQIQHIYRRLGPLASAPDFKLLEDLLPALKPADPVNSDVVGVIVETRRHRNIHLVLEEFLGRVDMPVRFFHGTENEDYLREQLPEAILQKVDFTRLPVSDLTAQTYNALLLSESFWKAMPGRKKVLIFQTDSLPCGQSEYSLEDFYGFDYIGSNWPRLRPEKLISDGGNGGLSLRDWHASVECLRRFDPASWRAGEDGFFAFHLDLIGYKVGKSRDCDIFSSQEWFRQKSWGLHNPRSLGPSDRKRLLDYCPNSSRI